VELDATQHLCLLLTLSHHLQTIYFSHKVSFIMNNNPWELLDIDDSDLPSFVCPSNLSSFSSTTLTPSPTGVVQAIMMNQKSRKPLPTQEFKMCAHQVTQREFNKNPWLYALDFI